MQKKFKTRKFENRRIRQLKRSHLKFMKKKISGLVYDLTFRIEKCHARQSQNAFFSSKLDAKIASLPENLNSSSTVIEKLTRSVINGNYQKYKSILNIVDLFREIPP